MNMAGRGLPACILVASLAALAADNVGDVDLVPNLRGQKGREAYAAFLAAQPPRAFAVAEDGTSGWRSGEESESKAIAGALANCNRPARNICRVYALNNEVIFGRYAEFEQKSAKIIQEVRQAELVFADYGDEAQLRDGDTPLVAEGVRTVKTPEVAKMAGTALKPIFVDVLEGDAHDTLPGAWWIKGVGASRKDDRANADTTERLGYLLEGLTAGNKGALLVFFCSDSRCAPSLNAALRARSLGYTNIAWYRGGINAWKSARLPLIRSIQHGQVD